ncbi:MAG: PepSY-associated TM helix domain-containing protein [Cycloclasticus sp.]
MNRRRRQRSKLASLYVWHRYAGIFAAIFVILISISGIALNHTDQLKLKKHYLSNSALLERYSVRSPSNSRRFHTAQHSISQADQLLFIDQVEPFAIDSPLIGAVEHAGFLFVGLSDRLLLFNAEAQWLETIGSLDGVPNNISRIGISADTHLVLMAGRQHYRLNDDFGLDKSNTTLGLEWSSADTISPAEKNQLEQQYRANIINLETLLLDLHSGRFFGSYGSLIFDLIGIALLFLSTSGLIIWFQQRPKKSPR